MIGEDHCISIQGEQADALDIKPWDILRYNGTIIGAIGVVRQLQNPRAYCLVVYRVMCPESSIPAGRRGRDRPREGQGFFVLSEGSTFIRLWEAPPSFTLAWTDLDGVTHLEPFYHRSEAAREMSSRIRAGIRAEIKERDLLKIADEAYARIGRARPAGESERGLEECRVR